MRNVGPMGDQLADIIEPPEYKARTANRRIRGCSGCSSSCSIELKHMDSATKILMARITAAKQSEDAAAERAEERLALGVEVLHDQVQADKEQRHDAAKLALEHLHAHTVSAQARVHEAGMERLKHAHKLDEAAHATEQALTVQAAQPPTDAGAGA
jgi:hypothetical protein